MQPHERQARHAALVLGAHSWLASITRALPGAIETVLAEFDASEPDASDDAEGEHIAAGCLRALALAIASTCAPGDPSEHARAIAQAIEGD